MCVVVLLYCLFVVVLLCVLFEGFKAVSVCGVVVQEITRLLGGVVMVWLLVRLSTGCG